MEMKCDWCGNTFHWELFDNHGGLFTTYCSAKCEREASE